MNMPNDDHETMIVLFQQTGVASHIEAGMGFCFGLIISIPASTQHSLLSMAQYTNTI